MKPTDKAIVDIRDYTKQFYRGNWGYIILAIIHTLLWTVANLIVAWLIQLIIDMIAGYEIVFSFLEIALLATVGIGMIVVALGFAYFSKPKFISKAIAQYKNYVFEQLSKKNISAFSGENTSTYTSALSNDAAAIESGYLANIFIIIDQCALFAGALVLMFYYSPLLTIISIGFAVLPMLAAILTGNTVAKAEKIVSEKNENYMSMLRDSLSGFSVVKSFKAEIQLCKMFAKETWDVSNAKERRRKKAILVQLISITAGNVLQLGVFIIGAYLALSGSNISAGSVLIFIQLLNYVINPIELVPQAIAEIKASRALIKKLATTLSENVREDGKIELDNLSNGITVKNLSFEYEENKPILHDINFRFEASKSYCIVGGSGCGKSTLLNLLMASHSKYRGKITYDETDVQDLSSRSLYDMVSLVQQNVFVFNSTIRNNITMFSSFSEEEVERAIRLSGLSELVAERGEDYICGENGSGLSGGEKQRLSIARSLLKKSKVLLVDEATAALDKQTAYKIATTFLELKDMTRIIVTHSLDEELLKQYDCIVALKNGTIIESGNFRDLTDKKGYFYSLYTLSQ